jgi:hypothetical protein
MKKVFRIFTRLEMMFSLTSGQSSLSWLKNIGKRCSMVLEKYVANTFKEIWMIQQKMEVVFGTNKVKNLLLNNKISFLIVVMI